MFKLHLTMFSDLEICMCMGKGHRSGLLLKHSLHAEGVLLVQLLAPSAIKVAGAEK